MKKSTFFIHLIAVLAVILLLAFYFQRHVILVSDVVALVVVLLFFLIPAVILYGTNQTLIFFKTAFAENPAMKEREQAISYFSGMSFYMIIASVAASIAIVCYMFGNMKDLNTISPFIGAAMLSPLYGALSVIGIFLPLKWSLEQKRE